MVGQCSTLLVGEGSGSLAEGWWTDITLLRWPTSQTNQFPVMRSKVSRFSLNGRMLCWYCFLQVRESYSVLFGQISSSAEMVTVLGPWVSLIIIHRPLHSLDWQVPFVLGVRTIMAQ